MPNMETAERMRSHLAKNSTRVEEPLVLADVDVSRYDALVVPGGHGPVEDLPDVGPRAGRGQSGGEGHRHGPAAPLAARDGNGQWPFAGRRMTSLTDEEEIEFGTAGNAPWLLADALRKSGAVFEQGPNWAVYVVEDGNLLTGQNPASSAALADAVIAALR